MKYDAADPDWPDRDRFVLSAGHASMLLYSMLYLTGFGLELDDLREFRQWGSRTPGPPRVPAHRRASRSRPVRSARASRNAVGIAIAEKHLRAAVRRRRVRPPRVRHLQRRRPRWRASATRPRRSPVTCSSVASSSSTTTTTSRSTAPPSSRTATTSRSASRPTAGTSCSSARSRTTSTRSRPGCATGMAEERRPSLVVLRSHIGYPSPKCTTPRTRTATRSAPTRSRR